MNRIPYSFPRSAYSTCYSRFMCSHNRLNMNRIPYSVPRSAYSTCYSRCMCSHNRLNMNRIPYSVPRSAYSTCYSRFMCSHNRLNLNRIPYSVPRSAYSTCRVLTLPPGRREHLQFPNGRQFHHFVRLVIQRPSLGLKTLLSQSSQPQRGRPTLSLCHLQTSRRGRVLGGAGRLFRVFYSFSS